MRHRPLVGGAGRRRGHRCCDALRLPAAGRLLLGALLLVTWRPRRARAGTMRGLPCHYLMGHLWGQLHMVLRPVASWPGAAMNKVKGRDQVFGPRATGGAQLHGAAVAPPEQLHAHGLQLRGWRGVGQEVGEWGGAGRHSVGQDAVL